MEQKQELKPDSVPKDVWKVIIKFAQKIDAKSIVFLSRVSKFFKAIIDTDFKQELEQGHQALKQEGLKNPLLAVAGDKQIKKIENLITQSDLNSGESTEKLFQKISEVSIKGHKWDNEKKAKSLNTVQLRMLGFMPVGAKESIRSKLDEELKRQEKELSKRYTK